MARKCTVLGALLLLGCSETNLIPLGLLPDQLTVTGDFCTTPAAAMDLPVRVLFAIDYSTGMNLSDPNRDHVTAIEEIVNRYKDQSHISFGILRWGDTVVRELNDCTASPSAVPMLFTKDSGILGAAFKRLRMLEADYQKACTQASQPRPLYLGGTNYGLALQEIRKYIEDDLSNSGGAGVYFQYHVAFMTDGMPQSGTLQPEETVSGILAVIRTICQLYDLRIDIVPIVKLLQTSGPFQNLLPTMAKEANGAYLPLESPAAFADAFSRMMEDYRTLKEYDLSVLHEGESPKSVVVRNRNVRIAKVGDVIGAFADSDADGLVDPLEIEIGTDPTLPDTDHDGLDDLFEYRNKPQYDPLAANPPLTPQEASDDDGDGLSMFVEKFLKTDPANKDSDGDGVPDGIEFEEGTNPNVKDTGGDPDNDSLSNSHELRQHMNPSLAETDEVRERYSYKAETIGEPYRIADGRRCYQFEVSNITLIETLAARTKEGLALPRGYNAIDIWRTEQPVLKSSAPIQPKMKRFIFGHTWVIDRPSVPMRDPPTLEIRVSDADFKF